MITNDKIKATKEGKLYIKTEDFFAQKEIQRAIEKILKSSFYRKLKQKSTSNFNK